MEKITIRRAGSHDLPEIYALEQECFISPWTPELLLMDICLSEENHYYVMEKEGRTIGFAGINLVFDEAHIRKICIAPDMRRKGYGHLFLQYLQEKAMKKGARDMTLEVRASNLPAIGMYKQFDFQIEGIRKKYYDDKEDALIMWKHNIAD